MLATVSTSGATTAGAGAGAAAGDAAGEAAGDAAGSAAAGDAAGVAAGAAAGASVGFAVPLATHWRLATVPRPSSTETLSIQKNDVGEVHAGHGPLTKGSFAALAVVATEMTPPKSEATPRATRIFFFTFPPSVKPSGGRTRD